MIFLNSQIYISLVFIFILCSCGNTEKPIVAKSPDTLPSLPALIPQSVPDHNLQIAEYIRNIYEDKNGGLWFGTNGFGVAHYNGDNVSYYSIPEGFHGHQITGITEDLEKNIWFATDQGIVKYEWTNNPDGSEKFTNFSDYRLFQQQRFWSILGDSNGDIWGGSARDVFKYDGSSWTSFELPFPEKIIGHFITEATSWSITEAHSGDLWFSTNGHGVFKFDGTSFNQLSSKEGLADDSVDQILEDKKGNVWFGTRNGGLSCYNGKTFVNYTQNDSIGNNEVCSIYEDTKGNIWFSSEGYGVYCYNGKTFTNYGQEEGLGVKAVQTIYEDSKGRFWVGGGGGLYRFDGSSFYNVTRAGPWE